MGSAVPFGDREYFIYLGMLLFARGMDFTSTWVGSPTLLLEGNPISKWLRWKWAIPLNLALCVVLAVWVLPAIIIATMSVLMAARNFQVAWLMRTLGEEGFRQWWGERVRETPPTTYLLCLAGQTLLPGLLGGALIYVSEEETPVVGIGMGIITYAAAVLVYSMLSLWRNRKARQ